MDVHSERIGTLRAILDGFNAHDLDAILSHFAEDCVFESPRGKDPWGRRFEGIDEVRNGLAARLETNPHRGPRLRPLDVHGRWPDRREELLLEDPRVGGTPMCGRDFCPRCS